MILLELDKRHLLKQYSILNMVDGLLIALILITLIMAKFWLSIGSMCGRIRKFCIDKTKIIKEIMK